MLPGINIPFQNGNISSVVPSDDKVLGLIGNAVAVGSTFLLNTPYQIKGMTDVASLGIIDSVVNHIFYKALKEFYDEAGEGTELWIMGVARTMKQHEMFAVDGSGVAPVHTLLNVSNGKLHGVIVAFNPDNTYTSTVVNGLDQNVITTITNAQSIAENYTTSKYAPFFVAIEGYNFSGVKTALPDLLQRTDNRVMVLLGDTETRTGTTASKGSAIGVLGGRIASNQVHVNIGKVIDGALKPTTFYMLDAPVETYDVEALHDKGFVTFRKHVKRTGYFFTDDPMACLVTDDYHNLTSRRVIDKAYRIAYDTTLNFLLGDFDLNADGTLSVFDATEIEGKVIRAIADNMTAENELSRDQTNKDDKGVICKIDTTHNVATTGNIKFTSLQVRRKGYGRFITVPLGFVPTTA